MNYLYYVVPTVTSRRAFPKRSLAALTLLLFLCIGTAFGQTDTAALVGTVTDSTGALVPGATATITNLGTNISRTATTTGDGNYVFDLLQIGTYSVKVEANGFKTFSAPNLTLSAGDRARFDAKMEVGSVSQTVEVSASAAPALQTDSSNISSLVTSQAVEDVPLNGRNVFKLIQLSPGVTIGAQNDLSSGNRPNDRRQSSDITVNGQATNVNNNMIDGLDNNDRMLGNVVVRPSIDAIQEVNIQMNKYDASVGRTAGAVVNVVTKSGTNNFHGSAYEFFRNRVLNTNPNYAFPAGYNSGGVLQLTSVLAKPAFRQNQYGGSLGGPVIKNKTFFFADYEGFKNAVGVPGLTATVPTLCERGTKMVAMQAAAQGIPVPTVSCAGGNNTVLPDPGNFSELRAISAFGGSSTPGAPGSGPVIPLASQLPLAQAIFSLYPLPTNAALANNYTNNPVRTLESKSIDVKMDQHFSDKDSLGVRYSWNGSHAVAPVTFSNPVDVKKVDPYWTGGDVSIIPGGFNSAAPTISDLTVQSLALTYVHVFRPSLLLNLRTAFVRSNASSVPFNYGQNLNTALGQNCNPVNCVNYGPSTASGMQIINVTNGFGQSAYTALGNTQSNPELFLDNTFQEMADLAWNKGAHSVRFGVSLIRRQGIAFATGNPTGQASFTGIYTGVGPGDLLEGLGATGSRQNFLVQAGLRTWEPGVYAQDDWRATHWLTLNMGLRYDIFTPFTEKRGRIANWDPASGLIMSPSIPGAQQSGPTDLIKTPYLNIQPRLGFAATLPHNTVIRGGFGLSMYPQGGAYQNGNGPSSITPFANQPFNYTFSCTPQNQVSSNSACAGPLNNGAVASYGPPISNPSSSVGQTGGISLVNALPIPVLNISTAIPPAGCTFVSNATYNTTCPNNPYNVGIPTGFWAGYTDAVIEQFNLQVQKQVGENVISVGYVGVLGRHLGIQYFPNHFSNGPQAAAGVAPLATQYPWLAKSAIAENYAPWGTNSYNSLQVAFVRRFSKGLTTQANYTWSHMLTNSNATCTPTVSDSVLGFGNLPAYTNPCFYDSVANPATQVSVTKLTGGNFGVGNNGLNVPNRVSWTVNYQLPFGKSLHGVAGAIIKGWAANDAFAWQTGDPFSITTTAQPAGGQLPSAGGNGVVAGSGRPDQVCSGNNASKSLENWGVNPTCFKLPTVNGYGNEHSNQFYGPSHSVMDFSLTKDFQVTEKIRAQFRTEVFNLFNTPNFSAPSVTAIPSFGGGTNTAGATADLQGSPTAAKVGAIQSLNNNYNSRQIQFAVKILF